MILKRADKIINMHKLMEMKGKQKEEIANNKGSIIIYLQD